MDVEEVRVVVACGVAKFDTDKRVGATCIPTADGSLHANVIATPFSNHAIYHNTYDNWAPRLGLAYRLRPSTVIRAAGGRVFDNRAGVTQLSPNYESTLPHIGQQIPHNLNHPTSARAFATLRLP